MVMKLACMATLVMATGLTAAQPAPRPPTIHMIYMGGNDCPPCVRWRAQELPRLQQTQAFKSIKFTHVQKSIGSTVPPSIFLPEDARPYKDQLDAASGGQGGSAQVAIVVDGKVYDYYFGTRNAEDVERMILAIRNGTSYPFERCVKRERSRACAARS
jgi:hypothetical protein